MYGNIEEMTLDNINYRKVIKTTKTQQLVLMSLMPGEDIPNEIHPNTTQFIRIESGKALVISGDQTITLKDGDFIIIPPNTEHYVANNGDKPLKLYTIYSPPEHQPGIMQKSQPK